MLGAHMELSQAVKEFLEPYPDLQSAEREIAVIGMVLQSFQGVPYAHRKRILEYAQHWVESEQKYKEIRDAETKSLAASKDSGRKQGGCPHGTYRKPYCKACRGRKIFSKFKVKRKSAVSASEGFNGNINDRHSENIEGIAAPSGIPEIDQDLSTRDSE